MIRTTTAAFILCTLAGSARAQTSASLDLRVSLDGVNWVNQVMVLPGTRVHCALFIGFAGGGYGVSGAVYQIRGVGGVAGDTIDISSPGMGRQGTFNFGAATQAVFGDATSFRIDAASDAGDSRNAGIATAQNSPPNLGANFNSSNPALVYKFDYVLTASEEWRQLELTTPLDQLKGVPSDTAHGVIGIYSDANATRGTNVTNVTVDGATIYYFPTPGSAAMLVIGGVFGASVRRRA